MMKLGFTATMSKQKPSLYYGSQTRDPHPNMHSKFSQMWKWRWLCCLLLGHNSSWISTSSLDNGQGILSEGDEKAEKENEEKKAWIVKGKKKMVTPSWQHSGTFLPSDLWFSHKICDDARPPASVPTKPSTNGDFFLFTKLKSVMKGRQLQSVKETKENLLAELCCIPMQACQECFQNWKKCSEQYIKSGGEYFEGDKAQWLQIKWANILFKLFRIIMDRPHTQPEPILPYPS